MLLAPVVVPVLLTNGLPAILFAIVAIAFPVWGSVLLPFSCAPYPVLQDFVTRAIVEGARAHAQVWGLISLMIIMGGMTTLVRKLLWELVASFDWWTFKRGPPNGQAGFNVS